jgi:eukaryotic-like serine/threonine-protein kinase
VVGSAVGLLSLMPFVSLHWSRPAAAVGDSLFASPAAAVATLLGLALPVSFAHAILRHRLFDVGYLIRAGLQYALARGVLVSVVPAVLAIFLADLWVHREAPVGEVVGARGWGYLGLAGLAVMARLHRGRWLEALDRRFFRERYNAEQLLRRIGEEVRVSRGIDAVASSVVAKTEAALHPKVTALLVRAPGGEAYRVAASAPVAAQVGTLRAGSRIAGLLHVLQAPLRVAAVSQARLLRELPPDDLAWLEQARADLIVPVCDARGAVPALLVLGPRRSQEPYSAGDEDLLMAIAHSLAALPLATAPGGGADERVSECPQCGACYDGAPRQCARDGAALAVLPLPRRLAGRYRLDRRIARGGMGTVYDAFDTALSRRVAVKLLREDVADAAGGSLERFTAEARVAASLVHPHVVTIHDIGITAEGRAFFVMELVEGETLREVLRRTGPMPPDRTRRLLSAMCAAVEAAHRRNIIHRDLKPENVIVCEGDQGERIKVLDFGLAKPLDVPDGVALTRPGLIGGTPEYMSPEHRRGGDPSPDWDLWALGVMAFEMLTGARPARTRGGATADSGADTVLVAPGPADPVGGGWPPSFDRFFARALSLNPLERPESARELLETFDAALEASHAVRA